MSLETSHLAFDEFLLDLDERVLLRDNRLLTITPKAFLLLRILIENRGHIVEKEELMRLVWNDSFVEPGNLSFTVNQLRRVLDDDARHPRFIETVPRRGYRFVADVTAKDQLNGSGAVNGIPGLTAQKNTRRGYISLFAAAFVVLIAVVSLGSWYASRNQVQTAPVLTSSFAVEKLSTDGAVRHAAISPDGSKIVYVSGKQKQSVWLRQLDTANNIEIIPPSDDFYYGLAFSPDGNSFYFVRRPRIEGAMADVYRISIFGGVPIKIVGTTQGWISISPDGGKISFVRCLYTADEYCSLWIADASDGQNEQKLAARGRPFRIRDNKFSPDGKSIAFAVGQSENQANEFGLNEFIFETGIERELTAEKFFNIRALEWLPDANGLLVTASRIPYQDFLIWQISRTGKAVPMTKDQQNYSGLSLNRDASILVSTLSKADFRLSLWNTGNSAAEPRVLADALTVNFAPDGKIIFSSQMTGNEDIWSMNADGGERRQLTNNPADESRPVVSPDNSSIFFTSNRTGEAHVWRMSSDGSNHTQITTKEGGFPLSVSLDGKWLFYLHGIDRTLWRVAVSGGEEKQVLDKRTHHLAVSPDGSMAVFPQTRSGEFVLNTVSLADGAAIASYQTPDPKGHLTKLIWSQDGKFLAYGLADSEFRNNTLWFQFLNEKSPKQIADLGDDVLYEGTGIAVSFDGERFAVVKGGWMYDAVIIKGLN